MLGALKTIRTPHVLYWSKTEASSFYPRLSRLILIQYGIYNLSKTFRAPPKQHFFIYES